MELIVISQSKLKIMLTPPDMQRYELSAEQMDCADEQTRRAFRHIFEDARDRIGFETAGQKLLVQLYTSREGGCEIFVTKLGESQGDAPYDPKHRPDAGALTAPEEALLRRVMADGGHSAAGAPSHPTKAGLPSTRSSPALPAEAELRQVAVAFPHLSALLAACHRLQATGYQGDSDAYIDDSERVPAPSYLFLKIAEPPLAGRQLPDRYAFLQEYGRTVDPSPLRLYVSEHGHPLCRGNAVSTLADL